MSSRLIVVALATLGCDPGGWRVLDTGSPARLRDVHVVSPERTLAAGARGTIIEYDGENVVETSTDADLGPGVPDFYGIASTSGVDRVAGDDGIVLVRKEDEYLRETSRTEARLLMMMAASPTILYAGGESGRVIRGVAGEWERVDVGASGTKITGGWAISDRAVAFTTDAGEVIERDGDRWVATSVETGTAALPLFGVWSSTVGADTYAVGLGGSIYKRPEGEEEFELEATAPGDLYAIFGASPDRIWAVGVNGIIFQWDGLAWKGVPSGTSQDLYAIHGTSDGTFVVAAGDSGTLVILSE
jgi:hypothetical protein